MAITGRLSHAEILKRYTHRGWLALCPVWLGQTHSDSPEIAERNWVPEWWFAVNIALSSGSLLGWPLLITGEL